MKPTLQKEVPDKHGFLRIQVSAARGSLFDARSAKFVGRVNDRPHCKMQNANHKRRNRDREAGQFEFYILHFPFCIAEQSIIRGPFSAAAGLGAENHPQSVGSTHLRPRICRRRADRHFAGARLAVDE